MADMNDPWATEDLIPFSAGEVTVVDSYFETGKFSTQLVLVYHVDVPQDPIDFAAETFNGWYSVGKDWVVVDNGTRITKPTSDPSRMPKIHASSNYGRLIDRVIKDLGFSMTGRGYPTDAAVWKGIRFQLVRETIRYEGLPPREGEVVEEGAAPKITEASILLPLHILGEIGGAAPSITSTVTPAVNTITPATAVPTAAFNGASPEEYLLSVIVGKSSLIEAKSAAMRDPQIAGDDALSSKILEGRLIESWSSNGVITFVDNQIARGVVAPTG